MRLCCLGFVFLICYPGVFKAQAPPLSCNAPELDAGFLVPLMSTYPHESKLFYSCNTGYKPAAEGWWATTTCQNGVWSSQPQCIDVKDCMPPNTPNGKITPSDNGWYEEGSIITVTCDDAYQPEGRITRATCVNGTWSSALACKKDSRACHKPGKIPHAAIIHQKYQEVFASRSQLQYQCEEGFTIDGQRTRNTITCRSGNWTETPPCKRQAGHNDASGGHGHDGRTQPEVGNRGTTPDRGHSGSGTGRGQDTSDRHAAQPRDGDRTTGQDGGSAERGQGGGHVTSAVGGGGSSTTVGSMDRNNQPLVTPIYNCGRFPAVANGDVLEQENMFLKYKCGAYYTLEGPETVVCYSDGTWSPTPICREAFCRLDPAVLATYRIALSQAQYVKEGEGTWIPCGDNYFHSARCVNGAITVTHCCRYYDHSRGVCPQYI